MMNSNLRPFHKRLSGKFQKLFETSEPEYPNDSRTFLNVFAPFFTKTPENDYFWQPLSSISNDANLCRRLSSTANVPNDTIILPLLFLTKTILIALLKNILRRWDDDGDKRRTEERSGEHRNRRTWNYLEITSIVCMMSKLIKSNIIQLFAESHDLM